MKAMILAAGYGTRLRPLTDSVPKPLLPIGGVPLLIWHLSMLRAHGVSEIVINLHHLGHRIEQAIGDGTRWGVRVTYSYEPKILGTGGGIKQVEGFFGDEPFVVINGDVLCDLPLAALMMQHRASGAMATMVLREVPDPWSWGAVEMDRNGRIHAINGRGYSALRARVAQPVKPYMFAGIHVLRSRVLRYCPLDRYSSIIDAYVAALEHGDPIYGYRLTEYWQDIGTPERYAQAQRDVEAGLVKRPFAVPNQDRFCAGGETIRPEDNDRPFAG